MSTSKTTKQKDVTTELDELASQLGTALNISPPIDDDRDVPLEPSKSPTETAKEEFERQWSPFEPKVLEVVQKKKDRFYDGDACKAPLKDFEVASAEVNSHKESGDYGEALNSVKKTKIAISELELAFEKENKEAKEKYDSKLKELQSDIDNYKLLIAGNKFGNPPHEHFAVFIRAFPSALKTVEDLVSNKNYGFAFKMLNQLGLMELPRFAKATQAFEKHCQGPCAEAERLNGCLKGGVYDGLDTEAGEFTKTRKAMLKAIDDVKKTQDYGNAYTAIDAFEKAAADLREATVKRLMTQTGKSATKQATTLAKQDPALLKIIAGKQGGPELVDAVVKGIGSKAKTPEDKAVIVAAITARYGPTLTETENFSSKNLPLLYNVLGMVPSSHVSSDTVGQIQSHVFTRSEGGEYVGGDYANKTIRIAKTSEGTQFKSTTLHEVGHAVDDRKNLMTKAGMDKHADWKKESVDSVADAIFAHFKKDFADAAFWSSKNTTGVFKLPNKSEVADYLKAILKGNDSPAFPGDDNGTRKQVIDGHIAATICKEIRESNKFWDKGDSGAKKHRVGDRVYQEAYKDQWWSYEFSARKSSRIRDYTFRAPGEWFADAYAAFYQGKLSKKHPIYAWLKQDKETSK